MKVNNTEKCVLAVKGADKELEKIIKQLNKNENVKADTEKLNIEDIGNKVKGKIQKILEDKVEEECEGGYTITESLKDKSEKVGINKINKRMLSAIVTGVGAFAMIAFIYGMSKERSIAEAQEKEKKEYTASAVPDDLQIKNSDRILVKSIEDLDNLQKDLEDDDFDEETENFIGNDVPSELTGSGKKVVSKPKIKAKTVNKNQSKTVKTNTTTNNSSGNYNSDSEEFSDLFADISSGNTNNIVRVQNAPAGSNNVDMSSYMNQYSAAMKEQNLTPYEKHNMQNSKKDFLQQQSNNSGDFVLQSYEQQATSQFTIFQGSTIPIIMQTGINSDLPGMIVARVLQDVYNTIDGKHLIIPAGSLVTGNYDSSVSFGQKRVLIAWQRLVRPDGSNINLRGMQGVDQSGYSGYSDKVDYHVKEIASLLGLSTLMKIGTEGVKTVTNPANIVSSALGNTTEEASGIVMKAAEKILNTQPTLIIRPGTRANIIVGKDINMSPYIR